MRPWAGIRPLRPRGVESPFGASRISPTRPVEDMKDMRARIRRASCDVAVAGLVIPAPASAQAPQEPAPPPRPGPAEVRGTAGRDVAALARRGRRARAREQRRHPGRALQPGARPPRTSGGARGLLRPVPVLDAAPRARPTPSGTNVFSGGAAVNTKTGPLELRRAAPAAPDRRQSSTSTSTTTSATPTTSSRPSTPSTTRASTLNLTQPLLRNFKIDAARTQIKVAKKNREISDVQFRQIGDQHAGRP